MRNMGRRLAASTTIAVMLFFSLGLVASGKNDPAQSTKEKTDNTVYVCSCMKTKSCPCMTEANMPGKCACGAKSPDMKAVPRDGTWAQNNRKALAGSTDTQKKM
jgi:hypothetical protein